MRFELRTATFLLLSLASTEWTALAGETPLQPGGTPAIGVYRYQDYDAHPQNWAVAQDSRGVMYFGNTEGVLEFDGASWRLFEVENGSIVRSLAVGHGDTLFVGAVGEIGQLRADETEQLVYTSLTDKLPPEDRQFADVWRTFATEDGVFFWVSGRFFRWHQARFQVLPVDDFWVPAAVDGKLYHNQRDVGLTVFDGEGFQPVAGGSALADVRANLILPAGDGALLIGRREGQLHLWSEAGGLRPFPTGADEHLALHKLYTGIRLPDGAFALTTLDGGVVVVGPRGDLRYLFDRSTGLPDDSAWGTFVDRENGLWLGLNRGLARIEIQSPIHVFGSTSGLEGTVEAIRRHRGKLYVATGGGLFRQEGRRFERVGKVVGPCWDLLSMPDPGGDRLLVGCTDGIYEISSRDPSPITRGRNFFQLVRSRRDPSRIWIGKSGGLGTLLYREGTWTDPGDLPGIHEEIRGIVEEAGGRLWLASHFAGVLRLDLDLPAAIASEPPRIVELERFGREHGLPTLRGIKIFEVDDELIFSTGLDLWRFDESHRRFEHSPLLGTRFNEGRVAINRLATAASGDLWISQTNKQGPAVARRLPGGSYEVDEVPLRLLPRRWWYAILPEEDGHIWFGGTEGLYRFDTTADFELDHPFKTLIRRVQGKDGTTLRHGAQLPYDENSVLFQFAATSFSNVHRIRYRYRLAGYDAAWSPWGPEAKKEYTNLDEGRYTFHVQAQNVYEELGHEATFELTILPPWYRTTLFRLGVLIAATLALWAVYRKSIARARRIQKEISDRERAIERERLIELLKEQNAELESFSYTISHDLKSPLLTIKGFVGLLRKDLAGGQAERIDGDLDRIETAAGKMARLLEDLLELSRVGRQVNPREEAAFIDLAREALELVEGELQERGVDVAIADDLPTVTVDRSQLVTLLQNLLQNAAKYMGDQISPRIEIGTRRNGHGPVFFVRDNGMGVEPRYRKKIFGLFERLDVSTQGTGIGLALAKRIVESHGGRIWVESDGGGAGSTFCFNLPEAFGDPETQTVPPRPRMEG